MMSTIHKTEQGYIQYTKGAPDEILKRCSFYMENGEKRELTAEAANRILADNKAMADKALQMCIRDRNCTPHPGNA